MKTVTTLIVCILSLNIASAQYEKYGVTTVGDTIVVWNTNIEAECNTIYVPEVTRTQDSISIVERDTSKMHAYCYCYYDISVKLSGLSAGNYHVTLYRTKMLSKTKDTIFSVGTINFSVSSGSALPLNTKIYSGACHQTPIWESVFESHVAGHYALLANYPNPFNPTTSIHYSIPNSGLVSIEIYDALGRLVSTLIREKKEAGNYEVQFDGSAHESGAYFCRLVSGKTVLTTKLLLLK
jgi:hypothetical protein